MKQRFFYLSPESEALFATNGLTSFDALWDAEISLVDEPNRDGEGWSEVGVLVLKADDGKEHRFYLKRQFNYHGRRLNNPFVKVPEALREWCNIQALDAVGITTMAVACCARDRVRDADRALFATCELEGYLDMRAWWDLGLSAEQRLTALRAIGGLTAEMHNAGYRHGCLYPKHVYIKTSAASDIRLIDIEKSRRIFTRRGAIRDLDSLLRRSEFLTPEEVGQLLSAYRKAARRSWRDGKLESLLSAKRAAKRAKR